MKPWIKVVLFLAAVIVVTLAIGIPLRIADDRQPAYTVIKVGDCEYLQFKNGQVLHSAACPNPKHEER